MLIIAIIVLAVILLVLVAKPTPRRDRKTDRPNIVPDASAGMMHDSAPLADEGEFTPGGGDFGGGGSSGEWDDSDDGGSDGGSDGGGGSSD
jgi:hypothetical protein